MSTPVLQFTSHTKGRNAQVRIFHDRIEWELKRGLSAGKITADVHRRFRDHDRKFHRFPRLPRRGKAHIGHTEPPHHAGMTIQRRVAAN